MTEFIRSFSEPYPHMASYAYFSPSAHVDYVYPNYPASSHPFWGYGTALRRPSPQLPVTHGQFLHHLTMSTDDWNEDRYAEYQGATDQLPAVEGPAISEVKQIEELIKDYESADPNYASKTRNLAQHFHSWRRSRPDGGCGWRAIPFVLFELLLRMSSKEHIEQFHGRLLSLNSSLALVLDPSMIEDFTTPTFELLQQMVEWVPLPNRRELLVETFNHDNLDANIAYHFKLLAMAEMSANANNYAQFLPDQTIEELIGKMHGSAFELEDICNQALYSSVLEPSGFGLEVLLLDRNAGEYVDRHPRMPDRLAGVDTVIRLLWRPGHYDIIYQSQPVEQQQVQVGMVHLHMPSTPHYPFFHTSGSIHPAYSQHSQLDHWLESVDGGFPTDENETHKTAVEKDVSGSTLGYPSYAATEIWGLPNSYHTLATFFSRTDQSAESTIYTPPSPSSTLGHWNLAAAGDASSVQYDHAPRLSRSLLTFAPAAPSATSTGNASDSLPSPSSLSSTSPSPPNQHAPRSITTTQPPLIPANLSKLAYSINASSSFFVEQYRGPTSTPRSSRSITTRRPTSMKPTAAKSSIKKTTKKPKTKKAARTTKAGAAWQIGCGEFELKVEHSSSDDED